MLLLKKEISELQKLLKFNSTKAPEEIIEIVDNIVDNSASYDSNTVFSVLSLTSKKNVEAILSFLSGQNYKKNKDIENLEKVLTLSYIEQSVLML